MDEERESKSKTTLNSSCIVLIVIGGMERFAFKGIASNMVTYLTDVMRMSNSSAAKTVNTWCGITSMLPLFVAPLADFYWDRYSTILAASSLYFLGLAAMTWTAVEKERESEISSHSIFVLFSSLSLVSIGQGGYNPSLQAFGADQLDNNGGDHDHEDNSSNNQKSIFFKWWYFGICSGSLLGVSIMSYVQDFFGWGLGFGIPMASMFISIAFFSAWSRHYCYQSKDVNSSKMIEKLIRYLRINITKLIRGNSNSPANKSVIEIELEERAFCKEKGEDGLDDKDSKAIILLKLLPIWTMLLIFAVIFQLPTTFFTKQGAAMNREIGIKGFKIPPAILQVTITVSIILLMPIYDKILVPIARLATLSEKGISVKQRMGIGMFLTIAAMAIAAIVEGKRLRSGGYERISILWLLPQYVILGVSDVFTVVGMQEFFYGEAPATMRTMGIALYTSVFGVGSFLGAAMISIVEFITTSSGDGGWFSDDMMKARLDKYYWLLAGASALSLLGFMIFCRFYKIRDG